MPITIEEILKMDAFSNVEIIAGHKGIKNNIENVYVMEVPDIFSYIDVGGLLFTTLFPIKNDEEAMKEFIENLSKQGLAGVAIKLGRYISEVPQYMLDQAKKLDFPILVLPEDANLSSLTNHILATLLEKKTSLLEFRETISQQLHKLLLQGADISQFVEYLSHLTQTSVVVFDNNLNSIESSNDIESLPVFVNKHSLQTSKILDSNRETNLVFQIGDKSYRPEELFIQHIKAGERILGYLVFLLNRPEQMTDQLNIIAEQAIILLAYQLQTKQILIQQERNYLDSFVRSIINGQYRSQTETIEKAKIYKWNFHFPNIILIIKTDEMDSAKKVTDYYKILDSEKIPRIISEVFDVPARNCKVTYFNEELLCFVSLAFETRLEERLKKAGEKLIKNFEQYGKIAVGISEIIYRIDEIKTAYEHAMLVHQTYRQIFHKKSYVQLYDNLGLYKLFYLIKEQKDMQEFIEDKIGKVIEYDKKKDMDLLETLFCLIKNNGNLQKTAEEMYIHYNSLRYRVNKLKELELELDDGFNFAEIAVACQLYKYLNVV